MHQNLAEVHIPRMIFFPGLLGFGDQSFPGSSAVGERFGNKDPRRVIRFEIVIPKP